MKKGLTLRKGRMGVAYAAALVAVMLGAAGCPGSGDVVVFDDRNLDFAVRDELGRPFGYLTRANLLDLTTLDAKGRGIRDLSGIEYCENLAWLDLDTNEVSDITPLANLTNLMVLNLDSNQIFDISPLAGLLNLDSLSLFNNQVGDIQALVTNAANGGLGPGDSVVLDWRTLSENALNVDVAYLETCGVNVILAVPAE